MLLNFLIFFISVVGFVSRSSGDSLRLADGNIIHIESLRELLETTINPFYHINRPTKVQTFMTEMTRGPLLLSYAPTPRASTRVETSEFAAVLLPSMDSFSVVDPKSLSCDAIRQAAQKICTKELWIVSPEDVEVPGPVCYCSAVSHWRKCFQDFIGRNWEDYDQKAAEPDKAICRELCEKLMSTDPYGSMVGGSIPERRCWWMQTTESTSVVTTVTRVNGMYAMIGELVTTEYATSGACYFGSDEVCKTNGLGILLRPMEWNKMIRACKNILENFEMVSNENNCYINVNHFYQLWSPKYGASVWNTSCYYVGRNGNHYGVMSNGLLVAYGRDWSFGPCTKPYEPLLSIQPLGNAPWPKKDELLADLRECLLHRQVIINALHGGATLDQEVLGNMVALNQVGSTAGLQGWLTFDGKLLVATGTLVAVKAIEYAGGDVWLFYSQGNQPVGCFDSRLQELFRTGCVVETTEPTVSNILGLFDVYNHDTQGWVVKPSIHSVSNKIRALQDASEVMKKIANDLKVGTSIIIASGTNKTKVPSAQPPEHTTSSNAFSDWWSTLTLGGKIGSVIGFILLGLFLIGLIWVLACCVPWNKCCRKRGRSERTPQAIP